MSRLATRFVAVLAPAALLLPAAAHAEQVSVDDAVSDAKALNFASDTVGLVFGTGGDEGPPVLVEESVPGRPRPCRSVRGRYDEVAETVTVSFPAACVGKPRWIQAQVGAARFQVTPLGDGSVNLAGWADDAFRPSLSENSRGWSPKVRRG